MAVTNGYTTLAKIKAIIGTTSIDAADDAVIEDMITQSSRLIDIVTRRTFYPRTETHLYDCPRNRFLWVDDDDLLTITTLTNGDATIITTADYSLEPANTTPKYVIKLKQSSSVSWQTDANGNTEQVISVAGTWGATSTTPADIESACNDIVISAYHRRNGENVSGVATITGGGVIITPQMIPASAMPTLQHWQRGY